MWSINFLWYSFGLLGSWLLLRDGLSHARSIYGLIGERKKRLHALKSGIDVGALTSPQIAEHIESMARMPIPNTKGMQAASKLLMILVCITLSLAVGYQARDVQAYGQFTERRPANWEVVNEYPAQHYEGMAYDLMLADGSVVTEFVPCEKNVLYVGLRVARAGFYQRGICNSFSGPRAYIVKERNQQ